MATSLLLLTPASSVRSSFLSLRVPARRQLSTTSRLSEPLRALFVGSPGSGKGTLSGMLIKQHPNLRGVSAGDLLRQNIRDGTDVGKKAEGVIKDGKLMPDEIMMNVVGAELDSLSQSPFFLDGFPRTLGQAKLLDAELERIGKPLNLVINLDVPPQVILDRILGRWVHPASGRVYNTSFNPPKVAGKDDVTGEPLEQRPDDNPETFKLRLDSFHKSTEPLLSYYAARAKETGKDSYVSLQGNTSKEIWPKLVAAIQQRGLSLD